jgi:predicted N-acetyltransferase YhbS
MTVTIRPGRPNDAPACGAICYEAFKTISSAHNFPPDFPSPEAATGLLSMAFAHPEIYGVVAELDGRVVGSNFLWEQSQIAGVGPITVDPRVQNGQVGRSLMQAVLDRAAEKAWSGVRLVQAAFHNRSLSLYTKLGFDPREPLSNMQGPPIGKTIAGYDVRKATQRDIDACNRLCRNVHGHDRPGELRDAVKDGTATVVEHDGRITGYATIIGFFGHAVGETNDDMKALIAAAPGFAGPGMLVPTRNADLLRWCLSNGLRVVQPLTLMSLGLYNEPRGAFLPSILY